MGNERQGVPLPPSVSEEFVRSRGLLLCADEDGCVGDGLEDRRVAKINQCVEAEVTGEERSEFRPVACAIELVGSDECQDAVFPK